MSEVVRKSDLAERLGLARSRISHFIAAGMPVRPDRKLDLDAALAWIAETRQRQGSYQDRGVNRLAEGAAGNAEQSIGATPSDVGAVVAPPYAQSRALRESALAQLAQLKLEAERGNSVPIDTVKRDWVSTLTDLRGRLLAIPARVAAAAPHLTQSDVALIAREVTQALQELAGADMA